LEQNNHLIADVSGDCNCFYRILAIFLGYEEKGYRLIRHHMGEYVLSKHYVPVILSERQNVARSLLKKELVQEYEYYIYWKLSPSLDNFRVNLLHEFIFLMLKL